MRNNFQSKSVPRGTRTIWRYLSALFILFTFAIGNVWGQTLIEVDDMETTSGSGSSMTISGWSKNQCTISQSTDSRTGTYSIKTAYDGDGEKSIKTSNTSISVSKDAYLYCIGWAKLESSDDSTTPDADIYTYGNSYIGGNGKGDTIRLNKTTWRRFSSSKKASSASTSAYVLLVRKHKGKKAVLFDDVVIYVSTNNNADLSYPNGPTAGDASTSSLSWTNRDDSGDGATGRQATLIWHRTSGTANDLTLNNQGKYVVPATGSTLDQSGHWTLISATVAANATSYSGTFTAGDVYAIVHRDLAYNYSTPAYVTIPGGGGGGGDPVDPVFTYTPATYTIGDPALDLSTKLSSTNTTGAITFAISTADAGTTGASIASSKNFTATAAGTAKVTVSQAASTGYNAKSQDIEVTVVAPDPCTTYFHFVATADATANEKTNWDGFTNAVTGSSGQSNSVTIEGTTYNLTKRTGSTTGTNGVILGFTIPANKAGTLYGYMKSSGTGARILSLKKGDNVVKTNTEITDGNWTLITISAIAPGTYTLCPDQNVQVQMFALKVCDATIRTISFDSDGGSTVADLQVVDGTAAVKPADPTKAKADFVKWVVKSSGADYNWSSNVTADLTLKAVWAAWPTLTLAAGEGATGTPVATQYKAGTEITVPEKPEGFSKGTDVFTGWAYSPTVTVTDGKFDMPATNLTLTAQWQAPSNFDVKFFQGYGDPDVQIGETQNIATGEYATAPTNPTRSGYRFLGWSYDATAAHIVNVAGYAILTTTNFTAMWQKVWTVSFDGAETTVDDGSKIASPDSPSQAGKVFQGWYNGESKYDFSANVTGDLVLTSKWEDSNPNHFYYNYKDDFHYDGVVYKTPEGKTTDPDAAEASNVDLTTPYTLFSGAAGITSIIATKGIYDYKKGSTTKHVTAYLKINTSADSYLTFTIKAGYTAVLKMKMGGYSANPTVTLKKGDDVIEATSGTPDGKYASKENDFNEITYDLAAGTYTMTTATKTLYISHIDLEATALPTYAVTYAAGEHGSGEMADANSPYYPGAEVTLLENTFSPTATSYIWESWSVTYVDGNSQTQEVEVNNGKFTMPAFPVTVTAQWFDNSNVARIDDAYYASLEAALEHAADGEIVLLQNINVTAQVEIFAGVTATIDLAGYKIEYTGTDLLPSGVILVHNGASLTIDDSSNPDAGSIVAGNDAYAAVALTKAGDDAANPAVLVINGGIFTGYYYGITGNGSRPNTQITINGGTITATATNDNLGIYHPQDGTLTVNGGTITAYASAIEMRAGTLVINGGTFTATASEFSCNPNGSGTTTVGAAIAIAQHTTKTDIVVTIKGGTFEGEKAINESNPQANDPAPQVDLAVTGGDFTGEVSTVDVHEFISGGTYDAPVTNENCAEGYVPQTTPNAQGKYSVEPKDGVCLIGTKVTGDTSHGTVYGYYAGTADVKVSSKSGDYTYKFNKGNYIGVTLVDGQNFQAGDVVKIRVSAPQNATGFTLYTTKGTDSVLIMDTRTSSVIENGIHSLVLPNTYAGSQSLYLLRQNNDYTGNMNLCADSIAVYRVIYPTLTAITINGVECTKGTGNAFSVTLPEEGTNLASMTIVPTIIRNAAHATTPEAVISNEGAWKAGDNTYRVMDKDGDYTDYTITITLQGNAETPSITVQPQTQSYCAGSEPTLSVTVDEPTDGGILSYAWFKVVANDDDEQVGSDATYTIASAGTYYVVVTNHVDGKLDASVTSENAVVTLNSPASITTQPSDLKKQIEGENITLSVVASNATGYQWYSCDNKDKENPVVISGAQSADYEFAAAAGFYYCEVTGLCGAIESNVAEVTVKRSAGCQYINATSGSQANLTDGTIMYACGSDGKLSTGDNFAEASSNAKAIDADAVGAINKQYFVVKFPVDVEEITIFGQNGSNREVNNLCIGDAVGTDIKVNTAFTDYTKSKDNDGNERSMTIEFNEPFAKEKYLFIKFNSALEIYRICYTAAIEKPVIATQPATKIDFAAGDMTATVVVNAVTEGTLEYQWYNADGDVAVEGATSATLTTTEEGTYYVIVSNTLAGHKDYAVKSSEATLAYRQANDATLSALTVSAGALDPTFDKAVVEYRVDLPKGTTTVPTLTATATMAAYGATAVVTNAAEFENYEAISTVLVTAEDHTTQKTYTVHYYVAHAVTTLADVTENTTWDWSLVTKKADGTTISGDGPKLNENEDGLILASYLSGDDFDKLEGNHNAYAIRNSSDKKVYQGASLRMHTTKGGYLSIWAANEGNSMTLNVLNAGRDMEIATLTGSQVEYTVYVQAGDVRIYNVSSESKPMRVSKLVFTVDETPDYTRDQMLGAGVYGTICLPYNVPAGGAFGATFYEMAGRNPENGKIVMDEVTALEAGVPYVFEAHGDIINVFYGETHVENPVNKDNGMYGTFVDQTLTELDDVYYFAQRALWGCADLTSLNLPANRAYVKLSEVDYLEPNSAPAPGRRRITFSVNGEQTATGFDALNAEDAPVKMMIDGKLFILRGEKLFDATGRLVK